MAEADNDHVSPFAPLMVELARMRNRTLKTVVNDVDQVIELLTNAREKIAQEQDATRTGMAMMVLQNPVKARFERINVDLKDITKAQKSFGKALDKACL
ncbi:hypothetical protein FAGAP_8908 [Fusarium agapanthi]|uniref:Uncharacterized protein n=1 Tax=Fusarium agapanthi TaxID=1803897 RepID=A0A9P5EBF3_9HYPO|nr:hypothetical protein FAGAP_8908 [Fusarium agapanthi]